MDLNMWLVQISELELAKMVGEGSFGRVYLGRWRKSQVRLGTAAGCGGCERVGGPEAPSGAHGAWRQEPCCFTVVVQQA